MTQEAQQGSIVVYLLASPKDEESCQLIKKHLKPVVRESAVPIELLDDFDIPPGADRAAHKAKLFDAQVVLSLVTVDFIDDDDVYERSQKLLARYNRQENVIVSIIVRNCLWKGTPLASFPVLPTNQQPINNKRHWPDQDEAITEVVTHLYESISEIAEIQVISPLPTTGADAPTAEPVVPAVESPVQPAVELTPPVESPVQPAVEPVVPAVESPVQPAVELTPPVDSPVQPAVELTPPEAAPGLPPPIVAAIPDEAAVDIAALAATAPTDEPRPAGEAPVPSPAEAGIGPTTYRITRAPTPTVEVDWREKYYRRVVWKRGFSYLIDSVVFLYAPWLIFGEDVAGFFALVFIFVNPFMESRWLGTPGKLLLKIQITGPDGEPISYWRAFWRNILRSVTFYSYLLIIPLIYQRARFRTKKKLFHDEWSKTVIGQRLPK